MSKVGIITLNGYFNYGNRLQNYALQEVLKSFDYDVDTVWVETHREKNKNNKGNRFTRALKNPRLIFRKFYRTFYLNPLDQQRTSRFKRFSNQYINETDFIITEENLPEGLLSEYKYFVTGSDQVWNPYYTNASSLYFLTFAPKEKRISYAASFGIADLPDHCVDHYREWLTGIKSISVREDAGAELINELTGREVEVLPDPTLLLTRESWLSIAKPAKNKPKTNYILTYFLGKIPSQVKRLLDQTARDNNLEVVNLAQPKYKEYYLTDPAEFLDYINSAKVFFTDSFHGAVFSILFETPFIVSNRQSNIPSMNSRINTLLTKYKLEKRHLNKIDKSDVFNINFKHINKILDKERRSAFDFLEKSLV